MALCAAAALAPHAGELVVLSSDAALRELGLPLLPDAAAGAGPLGGLVAALQHASTRGHAGALLLACDLPLVDEGLLAVLIAAWRGEDAVIPESGGRPQPLCALWSVAALPAASAALRSEDRSMSRLAGSLTSRLVAESEWRAGTRARDPLLNVNGAADLARARALLGE